LPVVGRTYRGDFARAQGNQSTTACGYPKVAFAIFAQCLTQFCGNEFV